LAFDLGVLAAALQRLLGQRLQLYRSAGLPGALLDAAMRPVSLPSDGAPVVVLGDAGLLATDTRRQRAWAAWGLRQQQAGRRALLLAPVPIPMVTKIVVEAFDVAPLGQVGGLRWLTGGALAAPTTALAASRPLPPSAALLRDLLYGNSYVTPPLLRRLRRVLQGFGHDLAVDAEVAVWRDASVIADPGGCTLHPSQRDAVQQRLAGIDQDLLLLALAEHWDALGSASPLVRSEFAQWWHALLQQRDETGPWRGVIDQALTEGQQLMRSVAAALWGLPADRSVGLAAYLRRFGRRSPLLLGASDGHQLAWTMAQRDAIASGAVSLPAVLDLALVAWVLGDEAAGPSLRLLVAGGPQPSAAPGARLRWAPQSALQGVSLCDGVSVGRLWSVQSEPAAGQRCLRWVRALMLTLRARLKPAPSKGPIAALLEDWLASVALAAGRMDRAVQGTTRPLNRDKTRAALAALLAQQPAHDLLLERWTHELLAWINEHRPNRPLHASSPNDLPSLLFTVLDGDLLDAVMEIAETQAAVRQHLQRDVVLAVSAEARCTLFLTDRTLVVEAMHRPLWADSIWHDKGRLTAALADGRRLLWIPAASWRLIDGVEGDAYRLPQGGWWDELEFRNFLGAEKPVLTLPTWAERHGVDEHGYWAEFEIQKQVQRLRFIPPGRFWMGSPLTEEGRFDNETLHAVILSRGYWLADSACTWELWRAVTGQMPEGQDREHRSLPATNVSHDDITGQFLPQLNRQLPGFEGRLPGEAEWEYAARAGSVTAFAWGDEARTDRMSFDQEKPGFMPVRSFPANAWGLHQMHGNVWEWCADDLGPYPPGEVMDPFAEQATRPVLRGGSWIGRALYCRSAVRNNARDSGFRGRDVGFRLARGLAQFSPPALEPGKAQGKLSKRKGSP
jgi:formylglycine-generating enzyme required for sulfatase activity